MGKGLAATVTNLEEIREYGKNTNLLNQKLPDGEWKSALAIMKKTSDCGVSGGAS
mgnify:FL=1